MLKIILSRRLSILIAKDVLRDLNDLILDFDCDEASVTPP